MSVRSLQEQIDSLLNKEIVRPKVGGAPRPDVETATVLESLALALMTQPKSAFYAYYLAKNGLVIAIDKEVAAIEALKSTIQDLGNVTYAIKDTKALIRAQTALLQLSAQGQVSSTSNAFNRYSVAVDDFLEKQLGKNVKRPRVTSMVRPGEEAKLALPDDLVFVKDAHTAFLAKLYAMAVGITNFINTPFSSLVGANVVYRTKKDLDDLAVSILEDDSGSQSRDAAIRLLSGRATVRVVGSPMDMTAPVVDTVRAIPPDQLLSGQSVATPVVATTAVGPFVMAASGSLSLTVDGQTVTTSALNQAGNCAAILGAAIPSSVTIPSNYHLFLRLEATSGLTWTAGTPGTTLQGTFAEATLGTGWYFNAETASYSKTVKVTLNSGHDSVYPGPSAQPLSFATLISIINTALGVIPIEQPTAYGFVVEFVAAGSGRLLTVANNPKIQKINIASSISIMEEQSDGVMGSTGATIYIPRIYSNSAHVSLGFVDSQFGEKGSTPASRILDAMSMIFPSLVTTVLSTEGAIVLTSLVTSPGVSMSLSGAWVASLGLITSYIASTTSITLQGTNGTVSPMGIVDVGDVLQASTGSSVISALSTGYMTLGSALQTFSGNITVISALYLVWAEIDIQMRAFLGPWVKGPYATDLTTLDRVVAVLIGSPSSPRRNEAIAILDDLKSQLLGLQSSVTSSAATLPQGSASREKATINGIISVFMERRYDRALDLLLRCALQEIFELDWQSASYGGNLMKAAADIAQNDIQFPDTTKDKGFEVGGMRALRNSNG